MCDVDFVGAGPVSARKIIEEIIANVVGVAVLGDPQCTVEIAPTIIMIFKSHMQYIFVNPSMYSGRPGVRPLHNPKSNSLYKLQFI